MDQHPVTARTRFEATLTTSSVSRFLTLSIALALALAHLSLSTGFSQEPDKPEPQEKPAELSSSDLPSDDAILNRLPELSTDYVRDLLGIYARLNNEEMISKLSDEIRRRDPDGADPQTDAELARDAMNLGGNEPPSPHEIMENKIDTLITAKKYPEVIAFMEKERTTTFKGKTFPFEIELGDSYASQGNLSAAREAYTRAQNGKGTSAANKALAQKALVELDKLEAVLAGYELIKERKHAEALKRAEELRAKYPKDVEVQLFYAQALVPNYHYLEALPMLEDIKAKHYKGQPFPGEDALAESFRAVGRFDDALKSYTALATDTTVPAHVREEAETALREVSHERAATVQADLEILSENEGDALLGRVRASAPIQPGLFGGVRAWAYDVELSDERSLRQSSGDFLGAVAFVRKYLDDNLTYLEGRVGGGAHGDVTWGASYGKESPYVGVLGYDISIDGNVPAIDSLQMIALNGVEDKIEGTLIAPLPGRFEASTGLWGRRVKADGADLGNGWGAFFEVGRPIWENVTQTKQVYLGYRAEYEQFDADRISERQVRQLGYNGDPAEGRLLGADLVEPKYHPHGLQLSYEAQVNTRLYGYVGTGLFFDFSDEEWDYNFTAGFDYSLSDSVDLVIEGGYYSDGTGASNDDSEVFVGTIGIRAFR